MIKMKIFGNVINVCECGYWFEPEQLRDFLKTMAVKEQGPLSALKDYEKGGALEALEMSIDRIKKIKEAQKAHEEVKRCLEDDKKDDPPDDDPLGGVPIPDDIRPGPRKPEPPRIEVQGAEDLPD